MAAARAWTAFQVRPRWEKRVGEALRQKGYTEFVPMYTCKRRWSDRFKVQLPLFPGYIFCRLDLGAHFSILTTPGVMHFVGIGKTPVPLPDREIDSIRAIADFGPGAGWEQSAD